MPVFSLLKSKPSLSPSSAARCVDRFTHIVAQHGAPHLPRVPSIFKRVAPLARTRFEDTDSRTPDDWAQDLFARIVAEARMEDWSVTCRQWSPGDAAQTGLHVHTLARQWHPDAPGTFAVDVRGNPVVLYRTEWLREPGALAMHVMVQLATLKLVSGAPPDNYVASEHTLLLAAMAAYNGQGLELLAMSDALADHFVASGMLSSSLAATAYDHLAFLTVLGLSARRLAPEQMIASYGPVLSKAFRKSVWPLTRQVDAFEGELKLLRMLSSSGGCHQSGQVELRSASGSSPG